jgi:hypothetical protein
MATIAEELTSILANLSVRDQERVLGFARELAHPPTFPHVTPPPGTPGSVVARLRVLPEAGEAMENALEECERIWPDE